MSTHPGKPRLPVRAPADLLAVVPHLLGFTPDSSLVVIGMTLPSGRVQLTTRYDLPDPPDGDLAADIADHARGVLARQHLTSLAVVGYSPDSAVTPVVNAIWAATAQTGMALREALRVEEGRYWSYLCSERCRSSASLKSFQRETEGLKPLVRVGFLEYAAGRLRRSGWRWPGRARISGTGGGGRGRLRELR